MGIKLVYILIAFPPFGLAAQVISSSVVGDAQDASGAAVPGAAVVITNISTGATRTSNTDEAGGYVFPQLPPGDYRLSVTHTGFKRYEVSKINLPVNRGQPNCSGGRAACRRGGFRAS